MSDLPRRLRALDAIDAPDIWDEVERRSTLQPLEPRSSISTSRRTREPGHRWPALLAGIVAVFVIVGVAAAGLAMVTRPPVDVRPAVAPYPTPDARRSDATIVWDNGRIRLEASALRIRVGDELYGFDTSDLEVGPDYSRRRASEDHDSCCPFIRVGWTVNGVGQEVRFDIHAEDGGWQMLEIRHRDGLGGKGWMDYPGATGQVGAATGERFVGDIRFSDGIGELRGSTRVLGSLEMDDVVITARDLAPEVPTLAHRDAWSPMADLFDAAVRQVSEDFERTVFGRGDQRDADASQIDVSARSGNAADDLWLLAPSTNGVADRLRRIDAWSGTIVETLDVAVAGCTWGIQAGPVDGDIWLIDNADADAPPTLYQRPTGSMCVGRFPIDGSAPTIHRASGDDELLGVLGGDRWWPGYDVVGFGIVDQKLAVVDGELYLIAIAGDLVYGLYGLDPESGDTTLVEPGVSAIARSGGRLYAVRDGVPSVVDLGAGILREVDLGQRRPRSMFVAGSRDAVMFSGNGSRILDVASGDVIGKSPASLGAAVVVDGQAFSADDRWRLTRFEGADRRRLEEFDRCERCEFDAVGATPGAVWFRRTPYEFVSDDVGRTFLHDEATMRRYDIETGRLTLERRVADLQDGIETTQ